jgi:thiol-disulfide isomerase/thioredoxin
MEKYTEALPYLNYLSEKGRFADAALNEAHVSILEHTGGEKMILPVLEMSVRNNAATPLMLTQLKKIYEQRSHTTDGFDAYVESLKSAEDIKKIKEDLRSKLLHEKVMGFSLKDMSGKTINTATWKNKIVILDYWATWCFPCKMAFPGMQLAVDRYAKDTTVDFYFIATMERTKTYKEDIKKYIQSSGYRFNVLYDDKNSKTGDNDRVFKSMVPVFHSSAIPRKVIIKDGYIRYTAEGYGGSPSKLMDELSYVIEMLKSE